MKWIQANNGFDINTADAEFKEVATFFKKSDAAKVIEMISILETLATRPNLDIEDKANIELILSKL